MKHIRIDPSGILRFATLLTLACLYTILSRPDAAQWFGYGDKLASGFWYGGSIFGCAAMYALSSSIREGKTYG